MRIYLFCRCKADGESFNRALRKTLIFGLYIIMWTFELYMIDYNVCVVFLSTVSTNAISRFRLGDSKPIIVTSPSV